MWALSLECGIDTVSWCAEFALRSLVSMSATGSVIVIAVFPSFTRFRAAVTRLTTCGGGGPAGWPAHKETRLLESVARLVRTEREAELLEQRAALVVVLGG